MKNVVVVLLLFFSLVSCKETKKTIELNKVENPEMAIYEIYPDFQMESLIKEDLNADGDLDFSIIGYDQNGEWIRCYFIHNGDKENTYTFTSEEEFWYSDYEEELIYNIQDYFTDTEGLSDIIQLVHGDLNADNLEDTLVIVYYNGDDYLSLDAYIFLALPGGGVENYGMAEIYYPMNENELEVVQDVVIKDGYFTIELEDLKSRWERYLSFRYLESEASFVLYEDGGKVFNDEAHLVKEEVRTSDHFGIVYFKEFNPELNGLFSIKPSFNVKTVAEFLEVLGNDRTIYLEAGVYKLNDINALPQAAQQSFLTAKNAETFYTSEFYHYTCGWANDSSEINLLLTGLYNTDIVGVGDVKFVVDNEFISVLSFEGCSKMNFENVYLVHDVGGTCGADVIEVINSSRLNFLNCVFDGSGEIAIDARSSYFLDFNSCRLSNCSSGAIEFYESDAVFQSCFIEDNVIWYALVSASAGSDLYFHDCSFANNKADNSPNPENSRHFFLTKDNAYIFLDEDCQLSNNDKIKMFNDVENVSIPKHLLY